MNRYLLLDNEDQNARKESDRLADLAEYFESIEQVQFFQLGILDRETQELIRWDLCMHPTWYHPSGFSCKLLSDWFQALAIAGSGAIA
jgi:hypothetical protein